MRGLTHFNVSQAKHNGLTTRHDKLATQNSELLAECGNMQCFLKQVSAADTYHGLLSAYWWLWSLHARWKCAYKPCSVVSCCCRPMSLLTASWRLRPCCVLHTSHHATATQQRLLNLLRFLLLLFEQARGDHNAAKKCLHRKKVEASAQLAAALVERTVRHLQTCTALCHCAAQHLARHQQAEARALQLVVQMLSCTGASHRAVGPAVTCVLSCLLLLQVEVDRLRREAAAAEAACNTLRDEAKERLDVVCKLQGKLDSLKSKLSATQQRLQESQERLQESRKKLQEAQHKLAEVTERNTEVSLVLLTSWQSWASCLLHACCVAVLCH